MKAEASTEDLPARGVPLISKILPHLSLLGVDVIDERPYELAMSETDRRSSTTSVCGCQEVRAVRSRWTPEARHRFMEAFSASYVADNRAR